MSQNITTFDPLISCTTYKWEVLIKKIDLDGGIKIPDSKFIIFVTKYILTYYKSYMR